MTKQLNFNAEEGVKYINEKVKELLKEKKVVIIGIAGGSSSGKTYISRKIEGKELTIDDYYIGLEDMNKKGIGENFDCPEALDLDLLKKHIAELKQNKTINKPIYSFKKSAPDGFQEFEPANIIIIEGLFALNEALKDELDLKVFVYSPEKTRLDRRISRDTVERGQTKEDIIDRWNEFVTPMHDKHIGSTKKYADVVINN